MRLKNGGSSSTEDGTQSIREGRNPAVVHRAERIVERCNRRE